MYQRKPTLSAADLALRNASDATAEDSSVPVMKTCSGAVFGYTGLTTWPVAGSMMAAVVYWDARRPWTEAKSPRRYVKLSRTVYELEVNKILF